jgi:hypothetical protein
VRFTVELLEVQGVPVGSIRNAAAVGVLVMTGLLLPCFSASLAAQGSATISGTVTDAATGSAAVMSTAHEVRAYDAAGSILGRSTITSGAYSIAVPAGTYFVAVAVVSGNVSTEYALQVFDRFPCFPTDCLVTAGTPVTVAAGEERAIDFALSRVGRLSGRITVGGAVPASDFRILAFSAAGALVGNENVRGNDGNYEVGALPPGRYFVQVDTAEGGSALYAGLPCALNQCTPITGTPITVVSGETTTGIDVDLPVAARVVGTVTGVPESIFGPFATLSSGTVTVASVAAATPAGSMATFEMAGVRPGTYSLVVTGSTSSFLTPDYRQYRGEATVVVTAPGEVVTVTVALQPVTPPQSRITGTLTCDSLCLNEIRAYDSAGVLVAAAGTFAPDPANLRVNTFQLSHLAAGQYYLVVGNWVAQFHTATVPGRYVEHVVGGGDCVTVACDPRSGIPITVTEGGTTVAPDQRARTGGRIHADAPIKVFDSQGHPINANRYDGPGLIPVAAPSGSNFVDGLPGGVYYARSGGRLYGVGACSDCPPTAGRPIVVVEGQRTDVAFTEPTFAIAGVVRAAGSAEPLSRVTVIAVNAAGREVGSATTPMTGAYRITGLPPGSYFVHTQNARGLVDQVHPGVRCLRCDPRTGTSIAITSADVANVDFTLEAGALIAGRVLDAGGGPLSSVPVSLFDSTGLFAGRVVTNFFGDFVAALPPGTYFARTDPIAGSAMRLYQGLACPSGACDVRAGTALVTAVDAPRRDVDFTLPACTAATIAPLTLASSVVGRPYRQRLTVSGATPPAHFFVVDGVLPGGITLDAATGVLSGTVTTSGDHTFTVASADGLGCGARRTYTISVSRCAAALSATEAAIGSAGGTLPVRVYEACGFTELSSAADWLTVSGSAVGAPGEVTITVAANTSADPRSGFVTIGPRMFTVRQGGLTPAAPFGVLDLPVDGTPVSGSVAITGWALDDLHVARVRVTRDGVEGEAGGEIYVGDGVFVRDSRPDVAAMFPDVYNSRRAGWGYMLLTNGLPNGGNGPVRVHAWADDNEGHSTRLGSRTLIGVNAGATAPFGAIDTPAQGATIAGTGYLNWGWALTPLPKAVPTDGSTIRVYIDGVQLGPLERYNLFRNDVATVFPGRANSGGAVGYRRLDTTSLAEGVHTIAWTVTDSDGAAAGIGSRYFTVRNSADGVVPAGAAASSAARGEAAPAVLSQPHGAQLSVYAESLDALPSLPPVSAAATSLERLELPLASQDAGACASTWTGYQVVDGVLRELPAGAAVDPTGIFHWQPGPAFLGSYELLFVRTSCSGARARQTVRIEIR